MRCLLAIVLSMTACGSAPPPPPPATKPPPRAAVDEQAHHDDIVAAHRKIEVEQQDALALGCDEPKGHAAHERCMPSCYPTETPDPRIAKKLAGAVEIMHMVCETPTGSYVALDELDAKLPAHPLRGRIPPVHEKGSWQADVEAALVQAARPKPARGDAMVVVGGWRDLVHPVTKEKLRCVTVSQFTRLARPLDGCGGAAGLACEASGDAAARGINVVHYRVVEARALQTAGKLDGCQQAALEAIAVSRGMPRWRQYAKLNVRGWAAHPGYRTRFDGVLDEDALFAEAARLGREAQQIYAACGDASPATAALQEQSFHGCW